MAIKSKIGVFFLVLCFLFIVFEIIPENQVSAQKAGVLAFEGRYHSRYLDFSREKILDILIDIGRFEVMLPREMDRVLDRYRIRYYSRLEREEVKRIGEITGVDLLFAGSIENLEAYWDSNQRRYRAEAEVTIRIYDSITGRELSFISGRGSSSHGDRESALFQALGNCFSSSFVNQIKKEFLLTSAIQEVDGEDIVFFGGRDLGVRKGDRFKILERVEDEFSGQARYEQIGLLEVTEVGRDISRGQAIYAKKDITRENVLEEIVSRSRLTLSLWYSNTGISVDERTGRLNVFGLKVGSEVPFSHSSNISFGFAGVGGAFLFDVGGEHIREFPLNPGSLYGTIGGRAGISMGLVQACDEFLSSAGLFIEVLPGIKYYLRQEHGMTISIEGIGRFATPLNRWQDLDNNYISPCGPDLRTSGFGVRFSVGIGF